MLRNSWKRIVPATFAVALLSVGCETSSHRVVRTYEYNDAPPKREAAQELSEDEYRMPAQGDMVSPGEMVPPGSRRDPD